MFHKILRLIKSGAKILTFCPKISRKSIFASPDNQKPIKNSLSAIADFISAIADSQKVVAENFSAIADFISAVADSQKVVTENFSDIADSISAIADKQKVIADFLFGIINWPSDTHFLLIET